jgi:hypothetical protein
MPSQGCEEEHGAALSLKLTTKGWGDDGCMHCYGQERKTFFLPSTSQLKLDPKAQF